MKTSTRKLQSVSILLTAVLFGLSTQSWVLASILAIVTLSSFLPFRLEIGRTAQAIIALAGGVSGWLLFSFMASGQVGTFGMLWGSLASSLLFVVLPRLFMVSAFYGWAATSTGILFVVLSCGYGQKGLGYTFFVVLFVAVQLVIISSESGDGMSWAVFTSRRKKALVLIFAVAASLATGFSLALPPLYYKTQTVLEPFIMGRREESGFAKVITLGAIREMAQSDEVVMRITGPKPDHLRGIAYSNYLAGRWLVGLERAPTEVLLQGSPRDGQVTTVRVAGGEKDRYFLPLEAREISARGELSADAAGVVLTEEDGASEAQFLLGPRDYPAVEEPGEEDYRLNSDIALTLVRLAEAWTEGQQSLEEKLLAIEARLKTDYAYSLSFERKTREDPILEFLQARKSGHCEYFASAMALLGRAAGGATRVIGGYRVLEFNALGDYYIVREKHAHAWVEAWIPGKGWQTFDPTPEAAFDTGLRSRLTGLAAVSDLLSSYLTNLGLQLEGIDRARFALGAVLLLLGYLVGKRLLSRQKRRAHAEADIPSYSAPLPELERLLAFLAARGETLAANEPIEAFIHRVREKSVQGFDGDAVSQLLEQYAAWRYGCHGEGTEIARRIGFWLDEQEQSP